MPNERAIFASSVTFHEWYVALSMIYGWVSARDREGAMLVQALQPPSTRGREVKRGYLAVVHPETASPREVAHRGKVAANQVVPVFVQPGSNEWLSLSGSCSAPTLQ